MTNYVLSTPDLLRVNVKHTEIVVYDDSVLFTIMSAGIETPELMRLIEYLKVQKSKRIVTGLIAAYTYTGFFVLCGLLGGALAELF